MVKNWNYKLFKNPTCAIILEKERTTHSSILAWKVPLTWTEEPGGLPSMGSKKLNTTTHTHIWNNSSGILYLNKEVQEVQEVQAWATAADLTLKEKSVWKDPGSLPYGGTVMAMSRQHTVLGQMPRDGIFRFLKSNHWVCTEYIWIYKDSIHEVMCWK